jgi:hypothetical protein
LEGQARVAVPVPDGQSAKSMRTVHEELADMVFVVFFACSCKPVLSVWSSVFGCTKFGERSAWRVRTVSSARMVRE